MANTETYNGWTNRETWAAWTWISNTKELHKYFVEHRFPMRTFDEQVEELRLCFEEFDTYGLYPYMLNDIGSLWRVDWTAIANALKGE